MMSDSVIEGARFEIERLLAERRQTCQQIDAVGCDNGDVMIYVYSKGGGLCCAFSIDGPIDRFGPLDWEQALWPRPRAIN